jgi:NADH dehydrogenase FAD-containing subunit
MTIYQLVPSFSILFNKLQNIFNTSNNNPKPTILVVGSGWGATSFVNNINKQKYNVKVISSTDSRLNQPRMIADFEPTYKELTVVPVIDSCISVNKDTKTLIGQKSNYQYDYLIIATGSESNDFGIKGVKEHCLMFKTEHDLQKLKDSLLTTTNITIMGAGPTGIELAFKLQMLGHNVNIIEAANTILPGFSDAIKSQIQKLMDERNISVSLNTMIKSVDNNTLTTSLGKIKRDKISIWTCGIRPTIFVREMTFGKAFVSDGNLMVYPNIYALGDVVSGRGPPTAQNAKQQGQYLARYFNNNFTSNEDYKYVEKGRVIDIGDGIIIEYKNYIIKLPSIFRNIFYVLVD